MDLYHVSIQTSADALPSTIALTRKLQAKGVILDEITESPEGECWIDANVSFRDPNIVFMIEHAGFIEMPIDRDISLHCEMP